MTYRIGIIELNRENRLNDLVRLIGKSNCFHIRKRPNGGLKKLKPLQAVILNDNKVIGNAPANIINELVMGRLDVGDLVKPVFNEDGTVACEVTIPRFHHRPNRSGH